MICSGNFEGNFGEMPETPLDNSKAPILKTIWTASAAIMVFGVISLFGVGGKWKSTLVIESACHIYFSSVPSKLDACFSTG